MWYFEKTLFCIILSTDQENLRISFGIYGEKDLLAEWKMYKPVFDTNFNENTINGLNSVWQIVHRIIIEKIELLRENFRIIIS